MKGQAYKAITAINKALAQPAQEPVATIHDLRNSLMYTLEANGYSRNDNLYTAPPQRKPLTDEQLADFLGDEYHTMTAEELRYFQFN